jgi:hypothetical protein
VVVAVDAPYRLVYQPSRRTGPIVEPGWSEYGPRVISAYAYTDEGGTKVKDALQGTLPACFSQYAHSIHSFALSSH